MTVSEILPGAVPVLPDPLAGAEESPPGTEQSQRNISVLVLTALIGSVAAVVYLALIRDLPAPIGVDSLPWPVLAGLFLCAELLFLTMRTRRSAHCVSLSEIPLVLGLATVSPAALVAARMTGSAAGLLLSHRGRGLKLAFNLALHGFEVCVATCTFALLRGGEPALSPRGWFAALAAVLLTDAMSAVLVTLVIVTHDDDRTEWLRLPRDLIRGSTVAGTNTCVALVAALAIREEPAAGALLIAVAATAYVAYRRYLTRSEGSSRVERLYDFTSRLGGTIDVDAIVPITMRQVRDEVRARAAQLIIPGEPVAPSARSSASPRLSRPSAATPRPGGGPSPTRA